MPPILVFGEILYDQFESGESVLGGAPLNVAWHLQALGFAPRVISRLGEDRLGEQARRALMAHGMNTVSIQSDPVHQTGRVNVLLDNGSPRFDIVTDVAYDYIEYTDSLSSITHAGMLYHGSLALRGDASRDTLLKLRGHCECPVFVDVNLRPPFWDQPLIERLLDGADWVKLNHDELMMLSGKPEDTRREILIDTAQRFRERLDVEALIVTCGEHGAFVVTQQDVFDRAPIKPDTIIDTVGAGDAFSAIVIAGLLSRQDFDTILDRASRFAARICSIRGAVPDTPAFYDAFK